MIVFDLECPNRHVFEGWFGSSDDFAQQGASGLLACPICGADDISKAVMSPAVGQKSNQKSTVSHLVKETHKDQDKMSTPDPEVDSKDVVSSQHYVPAKPPAELKQALEKLAKAQEKALESSKWVGSDFAETARAMHYGEEEKAQVHGETSLDEAKGLLDEGIEIAPLPLPVRQRKQEN